MNMLKVLVALAFATSAVVGVAWAQTTQGVPVVTITTLTSPTATQIIAANPSRKSIQICNAGGTNAVWIWPGATSPALSAYEIAPIASSVMSCYTLPNGAFGPNQSNPGTAWNAAAVGSGGTTVSVFEY